MVFFGVVLITLGSVLPDISSGFSLSEIEVSSIILFLPAGVLAGSLVFGPFVDRFGYKLLLAGSSLLVISGLLMIGHAESLFILKAAVLVAGFGGGILNGEAITIISDISGEKKEVNQSFLSVFFGLGALSIPIIMRILKDDYSYSTILTWIALIMLIPALSYFFIRFPLPKQAQGFPVKEGMKLAMQPVLLLFSLVLFFQSGIEGITNNWTTTYFGKNFMTSDNEALTALTVMMAGMTFGRFISGLIVTHVKSFVIIVAASLIVLSGILILIFLPSARLVGMALLGLGFAPVFPVVLSYIGTLYPELSGTAFSIALFISLLGNTILNFILGALAEIFGMSVMPYVLLLSLAAMMLFFFSALKKSGIDKK